MKNTDNTPVHMSFINVKAGYDILTFDDSGNEIYLEVKALTNDNEFYWSTNEINISKYYKESYYLVLVKVIKLSECEIVTKINNPFLTIFNSKKYIVEEKKEYKIKILK